MKFVCDACGARYVIDDARLKPGRALRIRCKRCSHVITIAAPDSAALGQLPERRATGRLTAFRKTSAPSAPTSEPRVWHFARNGESFGPYSETELIARFNRGDLGDEAYVWKAGFDAWKPASDVNAFASAIKQAIKRKVRQGPATQRLTAADIAPPTEDDGEKTRVHRLDELQKDIDDHLTRSRTREAPGKQAPARKTATPGPTASDREDAPRRQAAEGPSDAQRQARELREKAEQARIAAQQAREVERQAAEAEARAAEAEARAAEGAAREREEAERLAAEHDERARAAAEARSREEKKRRRTGMLQAPRPTTRSSLPAIGSSLPGPPGRRSGALPAIGKPGKEAAEDALSALQPSVEAESAPVPDRDIPRSPVDEGPAPEQELQPDVPAPDGVEDGAPALSAEEQPSVARESEPTPSTSVEADDEDLDDEDTPPSGNWITAAPSRTEGKAPPRRDTSALRAQSLLADFDELDAADPESGIEMWPDADELPPPPPPPPRKKTPVWIGVGAAAFVVLALVFVGIGTGSSSSDAGAGLSDEGRLTAESPQERRRRSQNRMAALQRAERTVHTAWRRADAHATAERARIGTARAASMREAMRTASGGSTTASSRQDGAPSLMEQLAARSEQQGSPDSGLGRPGSRMPTRGGQLEISGGPGLPSLGGSGPSFGGASISGPERVMPQGTASSGPSADHFRSGFDQFVRPAIQRCNQRHMGEAGELLTGRIVLRFVIQPNGQVASMTPTDRSYRDTPFFRCLSGESGRWRFDPFEGQNATVERSYVLQ